MTKEEKIEDVKRQLRNIREKKANPVLTKRVKRSEETFTLAYWLSTPTERKWHKVTREEYVKAERTAGIKNKRGKEKEDHPASACFNRGGFKGQRLPPGERPCKWDVVK